MLCPVRREYIVGVYCNIIVGHLSTYDLLLLFVVINFFFWTVAILTRGSYFVLHPMIDSTSRSLLYHNILLFRLVLRD